MKNYKKKIHNLYLSIISIFTNIFNFNKFKKYKIHKFNDNIINIFDKLNKFDVSIINKFYNNKFSQISNFNKTLIFLIFTLFIYLFYLSIPSLYDKGRLQKVLTEKLINEFKSITGCPVIVNTSFNVRGEPIVNSPMDAFNCFMGTELDILVIGNCFLDKKVQNKNLIKNYLKEFELD